MKAFEVWRKRKETKTIGFLTFDAAHKAGEEAGWRAAMEKTKLWAETCQDEGTISFIDDELEGN